jgi:D-alanyl-D-alanine carboxypeptidase (penicillin-binding protein 5/6)
MAVLSSRFRHIIAAVIVAAVLVCATPAFAAVLDADYVGGVQVGQNAALRSAAPDLEFPSGLLSTMDGRQLWARDPDARRAMASTTKIMTAVVALESAALDDTVTVDKSSAAVSESSMGIVAGEQFTMAGVLKGVLVQSGNDAATLLAKFVGGSTERFVQMMNEKAAALDLRNTHYANPHGLDAKGHYSSASDLVSLARYAMRDPNFRNDVGTYRVRVRSDRYTHSLQSHNILLKTYKGAEGVKTGNTDDAGYSIVFAAKRGGIELIGAVMGAGSEGGRAQQTKKLFDWGFKHYKMRRLAVPSQRFGRIPVSDYMERTVGAMTAKETSAPVFDLAGDVKRRVSLKKDVPAPVTAGQTIGTLTVYQNNTVLTQIPLVADRDIPAPTFGQRIVFFFGKLWRGIFGD